MKISIITAVLNNVEHINACIESVQSQTYNNIEHIVIDGGSTDGTLKIIENNKKIRQWVSEPDKGTYDALNKGISLATGDIIGLLHSDNVFDNELIIEKIAAIFNVSICDALYGDLLYVSRENLNKTVRYWKSSVFDVKQFRNGWMPAHPTLFLKKNVFDTFGLYDLQFRIASDYDLMLRTLGSGKLKCEYLPEVVTRMRMGGASNKSIKNIIRKSKEDYIALKKNNMGSLFTLFMKNFSKLKQFRVKN